MIASLFTLAFIAQVIRIAVPLALAAASTFAADASFTLTAVAADWEHYFPTYLANGYFSTLSAPRGTEARSARGSRRAHRG